LSEEDSDYLIFHATLMYLAERRREKIKTDALEGRLYMSKEFMVIGSISGKQFIAELDTERGSTTVCLLIKRHLECIGIIKL